MKYRLTKKDVDAARAFYRTGFLSWEDAMAFLKEIYDGNAKSEVTE